MAKQKFDYPFTPVDEDKLTKQHDKLLRVRQSSAKHDHPVEFDDIEHGDERVNSSETNKDTMHTNLMTFTKMLEMADIILQFVDEHMDSAMLEDASMEEDSESSGSVINDPELLSELNRVFTPILVSQKFEQDIADKANGELNSAGALNKRSMKSLSKTELASILIADAAILIAGKLKTHEFQLLQKATAIKKKMKLQIQKMEEDNAKLLAQKYLVNVMSTNTSSVARNAAQSLLASMQH